HFRENALEITYDHIIRSRQVLSVRVLFPVVNYGHPEARKRRGRRKRLPHMTRSEYNDVRFGNDRLYEHKDLSSAYQPAVFLGKVERDGPGRSVPDRHQRVLNDLRLYAPASQCSHRGPVVPYEHL